MRPPKVYIVGSLKNPNVPIIATKIRALGYDVFDDWYAAGPDADDYWRDYEKSKGHGIKEALAGHAARHVYDFDLGHLTLADIVVLVMPAGKSGHLEFGWALGKGKKGYVLFDTEPERFDVMYQFADDVFTDERLLLARLAKMNLRPVLTNEQEQKVALVKSLMENGIRAMCEQDDAVANKIELGFSPVGGV